MSPARTSIARLARMSVLPLALTALGSTALAQKITWCVHADGSEEVPPVVTPETADGTVTLDTATNTVSWNISHTGMTGTHTATHLHDGDIGMGGPIEINMGTGNPVTGSAPVTAAQATELMNGEWYVNFHSTMHPGGEVRGQVDDICKETYCGETDDPDNVGDIDVSGTDLSGPAITVDATNVPPNVNGYLIVGAQNNSVTPPGAKGTLCVTGGCQGRYGVDIQSSGAGGTYSTDIKNPLTACGMMGMGDYCLPGGCGPSNIMAGDTWYFQYWHRQPMMAPASFTEAICVTFQ